MAKCYLIFWLTITITVDPSVDKNNCPYSGQLTDSVRQSGRKRNKAEPLLLCRSLGRWNINRKWPSHIPHARFKRVHMKQANLERKVGLRELGTRCLEVQIWMDVCTRIRDGPWVAKTWRPNIFTNTISVSVTAQTINIFCQEQKLRHLSQCKDREETEGRFASLSMAREGRTT